ncbi:hypothetical protein [Flavobacterium sp. WV_118_3]|jgi:hypothetical protein|uniref:hypothetical protein n=1 Tax=Flavobacterium sp. WV_118_3 TaxID=3151764 RepID=UPI0012CA135C|nr:hypothetical protein [Flavobacterium sp.]
MDTIAKLEQNLNHLLYDEKEGFLIKFHFNQGLDYNKLDELYTYLEAFKATYKSESFVPKNIMFILIGILPALYMDISLYSNDSEIEQEYLDAIYKLDTALQMCLNPDENDPYINTPLRDL